jgi:hypothetical protein
MIKNNKIDSIMALVSLSISKGSESRRYHSVVNRIDKEYGHAAKVEGFC